MGWKKTHDLTVKTGTYIKDGAEKGRYENVGMVMTDDAGGELFLMKRTFNPAGVPNPDGKDSIIINRFELRDDNAQPATTKPAKAAGGGKAAAAKDEFDDDIPL